MNRPSELFALSAIASLIWALLARRIAPNAFMSAHLPGGGYIFHPASLSTVIAALLCLVAAIYSVWVFPLNQKAALWHFWVTTLAVAVFWLSFYSFARAVTSPSVSTANLSGLRQVIAVCWILSIPIVLIAQVIFVVNFVLSISKLRGVER
jgi:hypothetical protein